LEFSFISISSTIGNECIITKSWFAFANILGLIVYEPFSQLYYSVDLNISFCILVTKEYLVNNFAKECAVCPFVKSPTSLIVEFVIEPLLTMRQSILQIKKKKNTMLLNSLHALI
jgi:hypothetical protein